MHSSFTTEHVILSLKTIECNIMLLQLTQQEKKQRFSQFKVISSFYEDTVVIDSTTM